jgi:hypothetical protein
MSIIDLLHVNAMADNELLTLNNRNGDVFTIAREVDFAFKTPD